jgi:hypothetical protein
VVATVQAHGPDKIELPDKPEVKPNGHR